MDEAVKAAVELRGATVEEFQYCHGKVKRIT